MPNDINVRYHKGRFIGRDFAGVDSITGRGELIFTDCHNLPKLINATYVTFRNCHMPVMPRIQAHNVTFDGVTGFTNLNLSDAFSVFPQNIVLRRSHHLERIEGVGENKGNHLRVESCRSFRGVTPWLIQRLDFRHCPNLESGVAARSVGITSCRVPETFSVQSRGSVSINEVNCKTLNAENLEEGVARSFQLYGASHVRSVRAKGFTICTINHKQVTHVELSDTLRTVDINCPKLKSFTPPRRYRRMRILAANMPIPMPEDSSGNLYIRTPLPNQKNYISFRSSNEDFFYAFRPQDGSPARCAFTEWRRGVNVSEPIALNLLRNCEAHQLPTCALYKDRLRRKIELFMSETYDNAAQ